MHDTIQNFIRENNAWIERRRSSAQCLLVLLAVALYSWKSLTEPMTASIIFFLVRLQRSSEFRILIFLCKNAVSSGDIKNVRMCLSNADNSRYVYWISYFYPFIAIRRRVTCTNLRELRKRELHDIQGKKAEKHETNNIFLRKIH